MIMNNYRALGPEVLYYSTPLKTIHHVTSLTLTLDFFLKKNPFFFFSPSSSTTNFSFSLFLLDFFFFSFFGFRLRCYDKNNFTVILSLGHIYSTLVLLKKYFMYHCFYSTFYPTSHKDSEPECTIRFTS